MNEKRKLIIDVAVKLFSAKGYHATSIQEIVEGCDIAKGSFYNYFKSKEELLVSIFRFFFDTLKQQLLQLENDDTLDVKQKFTKQIDVHLQQFTVNTDFIQMFAREQMVHISEELDQFMLQVRKETFEWLEDKIIDLYPQMPKEYKVDCAIILGGLLKQYVSILFFDKDSRIKEKIAPFLLNRLDSIVEGFNKHKDPLFKTVPFGSCIEKEPDAKKQLQTLVSRQIEMRKGSTETKKEDRKTLDVLFAVQKELAEDTPNKIILESLLLMFESRDNQDADLSRVIEAMNDYLSREPLD
ncbi:TetR/AcrR family transcriptional regulator [Peribacillus cavernae]|uniref:TetR/AcrR family transcriptional regulator n=1 Tax=Peribacillus cavernae TaxID=1674310 RepID=A0A433HFA4_9BACI|nr:TetR/AcrR family transcriptional regulator [Peribacillus cavernae]MDQ0221287.1 AcrR family transcriptional regulator [Peribacillus cavernae]RUQ26989.1 TetR/AcrR family transcriptional regulator [Peribacillus cavernae]